MSENPELPQNEITPKPTETEKSKPAKNADFWLGFFGAFIGNILLYILIFQILAVRLPVKWIDITATVLPLLLNIGAIIWFLVHKRPKIVVGILVIFTLGLTTILCISTECFSNL
jgi:hypothetical protein